MNIEVEEKIRQLECVICSKCSTLTHLHMYGLPSTNRDDVLNQAIFARINCLLLEGSWRRLCDEIVSCLPDYSCATQIGSLQQLFDHIELLLDVNNTNKTLVIVFAFAESLQRLSARFLKALFAAPRKFKGTVKLITVATVPWSDFESVEHISSPLQFSFRNWNKDELLHILCERVPYGEKFVRLILDTVYQVCRDSQQLEYLIQSFWDKNQQLCSTVFDPAYETTANDYKTLEPKLRRCCEELFYRFDRHSIKEVDDFHSTDEDNVEGLPMSTKYLLVAAYCASYNQPATDRRFFTKNHGKQRRRSSMAKTDREASAHENGPKSFDLQRLLFIYLSFLEAYSTRTPQCSNIHTQLSDLCRKGYLCKTSTDANLDMPKYKCLTSYETLSRLSDSLDIKLTDYLSDFTL
ncbi:unnamed protein product [Anisakis simplex]|uniref:Origin recognition complex subunit 5 n=1 Tax=Anisakis simplex TaxID=6269 RepID=A0A0M3K400_ANISI|nr:unnamed protein product [Anisakis simplex]